ncbi:glycosyltransferase family 4 protein [Candidatus Roizmanbacteria bacterium]|nr:glycosyltransferase family 4 protein [Candidatus Roizmanbacteria bacterium]
MKKSEAGKDKEIMNIGIDISQIVYEGTGVSRFTHGLTHAILEYDRKNKWLFFFSSLRRRLSSNLEKKIIDKGHTLIKWRLPPSLLSFFWNDLHAFSKLFTFNFKLLTSLDWFITSDWTEPPLSIQKATVIHDLAYLRYPETVDEKVLKTQGKRLEWVKKESSVIFADSYATKEDLVSCLKLEPRSIHVIYPGVEVGKPSQGEIQKTIKKYELDRPFILTVGKIEPRKNLKRLIEAFRSLQKKDIDLIIVGQKGWNALPSGYGATNVKYLGFISDQELYSLYSSCLFFVYPSLWEGFGYPIVEAMKLNAAVATSKTSSLKEIAENSAILFDPFDIEEIRSALVTLLEKPNLREDLRKKGAQRSKLFTWKRYYEEMIKTLSNFKPYVNRN